MTDRLAIRPRHNLLGATLYLGATLGAVYAYAKLVERMAQANESQGNSR